MVSESENKAKRIAKLGGGGKQTGNHRWGPGAKDNELACKKTLSLGALHCLINQGDVHFQMFIPASLSDNCKEI